jgi:ATP-dependent Clp protease ATP-binding subunit ClpX
MKRTGSDYALRCSFCHKSQDVVGKLISSPNDYPRAYICDECIMVCNSILEDDKTEPPSAAPDNVYRQLRQQVHALVDEVPPEKLDTLIQRIGDLLAGRPN